MSLPPILYHVFRRPLAYGHALGLQEKIHEIQLSLRRTFQNKDVLLLLEHRPVFTAGRRQTESSVKDDRARLTSMGADFTTTTRGGQMTYHGPGQIVGYPLMDLSHYTPMLGVRDYVCRMQKTLGRHLERAHSIRILPSEHTGLFLDPVTKIASIGVQVRHRLTSHGFAINVTREPISWFDKIVACGLDDVRAGCIESATNRKIILADEIPGLVQTFGEIYDRQMMRLVPEEEGELGRAILEMEEQAQQAGSWLKTPSS